MIGSERREQGWDGDGSAARWNPHISTSTFKIQTFVWNRNQPPPQIISPSSLLPLMCLPFTPVPFLSDPFLSPALPPIFPPPTSLCWLRAGRKKKIWGNESASYRKSDRHTKHRGRTEGETSKAKSSILNQSWGTKILRCFVTAQRKASAPASSFTASNSSAARKFSPSLVTRSMAASIITSLGCERTLSSPLCCSGICAVVEPSPLGDQCL